MLRYFHVQLNQNFSTHVAETAINAVNAAIELIKDKHGDYEQLSLIKCEELSETEFYTKY